jgi:hypothetical protein
MKPLFLSLLFLLSFQFLAAQAPEQFSFQGVARGADGKIVKNILTRLRVTIHSESLGGPVVYCETHRASTNDHGIFTIAIGKGVTESGEFDKISWNTINHFLQLELDPMGGNDLVNLGSTQLLSVPYALHAKEARQWSDGMPVIQRMKFGSEINENTDPADPKVKKYLLPNIDDAAAMIWYPLKGSFRIGNAENGKWNDALTGQFSFATGRGTEASGEASVATGTFTKALASFSMSIGQNSEASGSSSLSTGSFTKAIGRASTAAGINVFSKAAGSFAIGSFNNVTDSPDPETEQQSDRIFQIGNGDSNGKKNALTLLRNGNFGLGENVLEPTRILDIGGRPRIRHNGATAGIWFDNTQNTERGFVGMRTDNEMGFYIDTWQLWVNNQGNAYLKGNVNLTSDARLKRNLVPLSGSLVKMNRLIGYHYNWIDPAREQALQTGLIAQEVEKLFPELVKSDDKGFKSVNYIGLIPHMIESIKQLTKENEALKTASTTFESRLEALEASTLKLSQGAK